MTFEQFYTYNAEEWYPEEICCSACTMQVEMSNLQDIVNWATEHLKVCEPKKWVCQDLMDIDEPHAYWDKVGNYLSDAERAEAETGTPYRRFLSIEEYTDWVAMNYKKAMEALND